MKRILLLNRGWTSPYAFVCFVALREKGLAFATRDVALDAREHHSAEFETLTLTSRVPVLLEDDFSLSESSAIVEYLEDAYPAPGYPRLLPASVTARARARQVMAWLRSDLLPLREERSAEYVFYPHSELAPVPPLSARGEAAAATLLRAAERLLPRGGGPLFGEWSIADTDLAMMLQRLVSTGHAVPPNVLAYAQAEWDRPSVVAYRQAPRPPYKRMVARY